MEIFDSKRNLILDTNKQDIYDHGTFGSIYKNNDQCIKVFNEPAFQKKELFITLTNLNLPNFYKIIDYLYNKDNEFVGYITPYYQKDDFNILSDKDYLLRGINNIYEGIMQFDRCGYLAADLHPGNIVINKDDMIVIDIDNFEKNDGNTFDLNNFRFKYLLRKLLYYHLIKYHVWDVKGAYDLVVDLVDISHNDLDQFNREMRKYDKPIDYFQKVLK